MIDNWENEWRRYSSKVFERIGWLGAALVLLGYYLNANKHESCWYIWVIGNLMMALYCYTKRAYPATLMSILIVAMNVYGFFKWGL
tara:strand:+ start:1008 stop:1265 length:258 start_codon:yes stop_codon:yes gene_type:complete